MTATTIARPKTVEDHIQELQATINFQRRLITKQEDEIRKLKEDNEKLREVIRNQPIPIQYERFNPQDFKAMWELIDREAILLSKEKGEPFYWKKLYERLEAKHRTIAWNPETVRRRCQLAVKDGLLQRIAPGTYIYIRTHTSL